MLQAILIGHLGGDAAVKTADGREFTTFRVAHTEAWIDQSEQRHESTQWVDCVMSGQPAVLPYLKRGQLIFAQGTLRSRVYSSAKDRCMKAGLTINVLRVELLGSSNTDAVPARLYAADGSQFDVFKYYNVPNSLPNVQLADRRGRLYRVDENRWVAPVQSQPDAADTLTPSEESNDEVF